jgi:hypothetical protein
VQRLEVQAPVILVTKLKFLELSITACTFLSRAHRRSDFLLPAFDELRDLLVELHPPLNSQFKLNHNARLMEPGNELFDLLSGPAFVSTTRVQ